MDRVRNGFLQSGNSLYTIPKLGLKILFPAALESKMKEIAIASNQLHEASGTTVRLSKYRAYRYQTFDRECKIEGYGGSILRVMDNILRTLEPVYRIGKSECESDLVQVIHKLRTVKFIVHKRVADRIKSFTEVINKTEKNRPLIQVVNTVKSRLTERCVILSGDSTKLIEACKGILLKIIECTKPYWRKIPNKLHNELQQQVPDESKRPNSPCLSDRLDQIGLGKITEGCLSFYNWLVDAGYSEDHISAMHLAAMVKSQRLLVHKKSCSASKNDTCECPNPILELSGYVNAKNTMRGTLDQIQTDIREVSKSYLSNHDYGPSYMRGTVGVGMSHEEALFGDYGTVSFEC